MAHFEIWYALQNESEKYVSFHRNKDDFSAYEPHYDLVELAVSQVFNSETSEYVALVENNKIVSIMESVLAFHLYEDWSNLVQVKLSPITRCKKCYIMYIDATFYWDYVSETKGRSAATPEQVLAKVCIPTAGHGDKQHIACLAKQLHEADLGLLQKTPAELTDFVRANNAIEFELPDEDYYLAMAKEIRDGQV